MCVSCLIKETLVLPSGLGSSLWRVFFYLSNTDNWLCPQPHTKVPTPPWPHLLYSWLPHSLIRIRTILQLGQVFLPLSVSHAKKWLLLSTRRRHWCLNQAHHSEGSANLVSFGATSGPLDHIYSADSTQKSLGVPESFEHNSTLGHM